MTFHSTELWPSWTEMVNIGQRITTAIPEITLPDHQVHLLNLASLSDATGLEDQYPRALFL